MAKTKLDPSQEQFCTSKADHIRLLAPAGCGKTFSILHRCREIGAQGDHIPRFLVVTFTKAASHELHTRLSTTPELGRIRDHITVSTLNAYDFRRMRNQLSSTKLLSSSQDRFFAMRNQLRPIWLEWRRSSQMSQVWTTEAQNNGVRGCDRTLGANQDACACHKPRWSEAQPR